MKNVEFSSQRNYRYFFIIIFLITSFFPSALASQENDSSILINDDTVLQVAMSKHDLFAHVIVNKLCLSFEALSPKNSCKKFYIEDSNKILELLKSKKIDLGFLPEKTALEAAKINHQIKAILPIYQQSFTLISRNNAEIKTIKTLQTKKVGFLTDEPTLTLSIDHFLSEAGLSKSKDWVYFNDKEAMVSAFCNNDIDFALIKTVHPSKLVRELTTACDGMILPLDFQELNQMVNSSPWYGYYEIKPNFYWRLNKAIKTINTRVVLVSNEKTIPNELVDQIMDEFWGLIKNNPSFITYMNEIDSTIEQAINRDIKLSRVGQRIYTRIKLFKKKFNTIKQLK